MDSTPPAITMSAAPDLIMWLAMDDGAQPGRAQPVDGDARDVEGKSGQEGGHPGHVAVFLAGAVGVAQDDFVDAVRVQAGPGHGLADHQRGQVVGADRGQRAAVPAHRSPDTANQKSLRTCYC